VRKSKIFFEIDKEFGSMMAVVNDYEMLIMENTDQVIKKYETSAVS